MNKAIRFKNFSKEDFTHNYDGVPYTIRAGEVITFPGHLAEHFCHHLVNREMMRELEDNKMTSMLDPVYRKPWVDKCLIAEEIVGSPLEAEIASLNAAKPIIEEVVEAPTPKKVVKSKKSDII